MPRYTVNFGTVRLKGHDIIVPLPQNKTAMSQTRKPRGVWATREVLKKLRQAQAAQRDDEGRRLTYPGIAQKAGGMDSKTVGRFFRGEAVDRDSAIALFLNTKKRLNLFSYPNKRSLF